MRRAILVVLLSSIPATGGTPSGLDRIAWLQGCWSLASGDRTVEEQWMAPRGGAMLGTGRTVKDGRLVEYEFVIIRERGDSLVYQAHPSGQPSVEFVSTNVGAASVVFENAQHDFPQRIGYRRRGAGLDAWIEGTAGGKSRRVAFPYERMACPGS
jgi:hypothetical protein